MHMIQGTANALYWARMHMRVPELNDRFYPIQLGETNINAKYHVKEVESGKSVETQRVKKHAGCLALMKTERASR